MELSDRVAIVTGAARGQGAEHARRFIDEGAYVALADVRDCDELADSLGDRAQPYELDVARGSDWASMVEDVVDRWGRVDILVNNAGILGQSPNPILDGDIDNLVNVLNVNVVGTYLGMATAGGAMAASGGGSIVNVSSMMGKRGSDRLPAYAASKWAIRGLTQSAAIELAPQSIRVNTVMPGIIDTDMVRNWVGMADEAEILSRNDHRLLIKRLGISEDVTEAVLYLASDRASYVTGTDIVIDGGWTIS
jgi:3alpha(or 20beta)-hydroxysteroid dehydrogenase